MSYLNEVEEPEPYGCIYCGEWDLLYKWENDGPMCMPCIKGSMEEIRRQESKNEGEKLTE